MNTSSHHIFLSLSFICIFLVFLSSCVPCLMPLKKRLCIQQVPFGQTNESKLLANASVVPYTCTGCVGVYCNFIALHLM